jgi:hypothetical protein
MVKQVSQVFARRARLSSKAIVLAVALTVAALASIAIASHPLTETAAQSFSPIAAQPVETGSVLVPVVAR